MNHKRRQAILLFAFTMLLIAGPEVHGQRRAGGAAAAGARGGGAAAGGARAGVAVGPYGGGGAAIQRGAGVVGPGGASAAGGSTRGSYTTAGGSTINYAGAGARATGPAGGAAARGVGGVQVTTPGGQSYTKAGRAGGAIGPAGNAVGGRASVGVATGPSGTAVGASRSGFATGAGGTVAGGGRVGAAAGAGGAVAGGARWGAAGGPYGYNAYGYRGAAVGHRTQFWGPTQLPAWGTTVRRNFVHWNTFTPTWHGAHAGAWRAARWTAATIWAGTTWAALAAACAYPAQPIIYDYGSTIVYQGDQVYINGDPAATAEQYADQASQIALQGAEAKPADTDDWIPLGVFGMIQGEEKDANKIFQLAVNKDGVIRGNYYDALSDVTVPVYGSVDKRTQRAAWYIGERKDTVYETGIGNLTEPETPMLVHFGKEGTQQWLLVRLEKPEGEK